MLYDVYYLFFVEQQHLFTPGSIYNLSRPFSLSRAMQRSIVVYVYQGAFYRDTQTINVSIGASGLTRADLMLRLKRWLVAGLDDADWGTEDPRAEHVGMGGVYMADFCLWAE